ncbi:hypothetical protein K439DRAFT_1617686 [Ramaria rubella]|nr:hypothetical protein K439DRAFT_1617686 [Ramaria rubella]
MILILALYETSFKGGGDIFKRGQEDLRVLAMMLKSRWCEAAKSGVIRLKAAIDKITAGIYLPAWSDLDSHDLTATDSFIENEFRTCIPKLYTTRELSIWGKMIEGKELENTIGSLATPNQNLTSRSNEIHSLDKINDPKNPMDQIYEVVLVGVPNFHPSGRYCGQEMHQTLTEPQRALAEKATLVADMDQLKLKMKELTAEVSPDKQYIKISKELTQKQHVHLKTNDGLTIAFVLAADTMAEERQKLWEDLEMLAPQFLSNPFDSKDPQYVFPAYHFSVYALW